GSSRVGRQRREHAGDEAADFGREALRLQTFEGQGALDPQCRETVHGRPYNKDEASRVAFWREASLLAGDHRVAQDMEGAQPRLRWAGGFRVAVKHHPEIA